MLRSHSLAAVILAAGRGTRLKSDLPKALHPVCGKPMLGHLIERAEEAGARQVVVVAGHRIDQVRAYLSSIRTSAKIVCVEQKKPLGSGHAVGQSEKVLKNFKGSVLVLYCDTPLLSSETIRALVEDQRKRRTAATLLSVDFEDPTGYGRIVRATDGRVTGIVEQNDLSADEKAIREINVGCYVFEGSKLYAGLRRIRPNAIKKEYYLTDIISILSRAGDVVDAVKTAQTSETFGVNTRKDLAWVEDRAQQALLDRWMLAGVRIRRPSTVLIDADVKIGEDTTILPGSVIEEGSVIGKGCTIGPYARIRGGSRIADGALVGNFVEIVRSSIGEGTYVKHLSYVGDAQVGSHVNIGAGTITANYDGKNKHRTVIKDHASIGSGTVLIAPVVIGRHAVTAAGAVITKGTNVADGTTVAGVPARVLALRRIRRELKIN